MRKRLQEAIDNWQVGILPGMIVIGLVIIVRLFGSLQFLEWMLLDQLLRLRPSEPMDERIVIVGIDEGDVQQIGTYPIPDRDLVVLLKTLQSFQPRVIGLDIFRDLPVEPGHADLLTIFRTSDNIIGIEKSVTPALFGATVNPPVGLPSEQVGFADAVLDEDGNLRRSLLGAISSEGRFKFSFTIKLTEAYLAKEGISLQNGDRDPKAMQFGATELVRFHPNSGGYIRADAGGNQTLINFRSGSQPFRIVSLRDVVAGKVESNWFQNRIVLIGIVASSAADNINTGAVHTANSGFVSGVEVQAHAVSQIISAVLDKRSLLHSWLDGYEYLWIAVWGVLGLSLGRLIQSPVKHFITVAIIGVGLIVIGYLSLIGGWWIPIVPALLTFLINGTVLHAVYLYDQSLKSRIQERQIIIEQTFDAIHNGPLQILAGVLRNTHNPDYSSNQLQADLQHLNQELRNIYEFIRKETLTQANHLYLSSDRMLDLQMPLHESLYEVYKSTLERELPYFKTLKIKVINFEPMSGENLSVEQKQDLCRFLEEALCNVGKHASGATRLTVTCSQDGHSNLIRVMDNGAGIAVPAEPQKSMTGGRGTQQAKKLAQQLRGTFRRSPNSPQGTICELIWTVNQPKKFWRV